MTYFNPDGRLGQKLCYTTATVSGKVYVKPLLFNCEVAGSILIVEPYPNVT